MIIAVSNLKGGVGKTTVTTNIAVCFAKRGKSVCIVDTDLGQQSSMEWASNRVEDTYSTSFWRSSQTNQSGSSRTSKTIRHRDD